MLLLRPNRIQVTKDNNSKYVLLTRKLTLPTFFEAVKKTLVQKDGWWKGEAPSDELFGKYTHLN